MTRRLALIVLLAVLGPGSPGSIADDRDDHDIGDGPVIKTHVSEADCESGKLSLDEIIARGRELFVAKFNVFEDRKSVV